MYWRRQWHPTPVLLSGKSHGWRRLVGCRLWGREESDTTERLHFHFSLSCIGEGNGTPLQCSCLENPRDGGAWWAAVYGVAQSQTRLKQLSSSSSSLYVCSFARVLELSFRVLHVLLEYQVNVLSFLHSAVLSSVQFSSHSVVSDSLWPHESQHARPPCLILCFSYNKCENTLWTKSTIQI